MPNQIDNPPNVYDFGLNFNYEIWNENTVVTLVNVPWNTDYRDIVMFGAADATPAQRKTALNDYINSIEGAGIVIDNVSYIKPNTPIRLNIPFNAAYKYNYLRASNPVQPGSPTDIQKDYYYFISDVRHINQSTTEIVVQLDVWQTFGYDISFGNCYIERGHIGIANSNAFSSFGRDYLTIPEGIDIGKEYQIITHRTERIMKTDGDNGIGSTNSTILVVSSTDLNADPGTVTNPLLNTGVGSSFQGLPTGASMYVFKGTDNFLSWMINMKEYPWVTQGIISITMIPDIGRYGDYDVPDTVEATDAPWIRLNMIKYSLFNDWRNSSEILDYIPERYRHLKKLLTFPYCVIELTTFTGTPIILKPESWNDANATLIERAALIPPNQRVAFHPFKYNARTGSPTNDAWDTVPEGNPNVGGDDHGDFFDIGTQISNFPAMAIVNNGAVGYMAANANRIAFQNSSADWSQQRALRGNEVAYDQATSGMNMLNELTTTGIQRDAMSTATEIMRNSQTNFVGGATGVIQNPGRNSLTGFAGAGIQQTINNAAAAEQFAIRQSAAQASNTSVVGNQGFVRNTNKDLGDWAAKGDYENTIAGINAKVQDANLTQPSTSGQMGGEALNIVSNIFGVSLRWKMIDQASIRMVGEYFLRYGYAVRQFAVPPASLRVMSKFSYWKLLETYITGGAMPESFKQTIRGIFEKGVTVWGSPADIGVTDIGNNTPLGGITL